MRTSGVLICVPAYGRSVVADTMFSIYNLCQWFAQQKIRNQLMWLSAADIVEVRNLFLTIWYDGYPDYSHMLFVDADMGFPPELIRDMLRFDKPLTGVLYAKRQHPPTVIGSVVEDDKKSIMHGFMPAIDMGAGVMMISRSTIKEMLEKKPEINDALPSALQSGTHIPLTRLIRAFDPIKDGSRRLSEDISFCHRWRECGGELWVNVRHRISHVGPFDYAIRYEGILESRSEAA